MCEEFTTLDYATMKIGITCAFATRYGMTIKETTELFRANGIYEYLDDRGDQCITKMYGYTSNFIGTKLGFPLKDGPFVG